MDERTIKMALGRNDEGYFLLSKRVPQAAPVASGLCTEDVGFLLGGAQRGLRAGDAPISVVVSMQRSKTDG